MESPSKFYKFYRTPKKKTSLGSKKRRVSRSYATTQSKKKKNDTFSVKAIALLNKLLNILFWPIGFILRPFATSINGRQNLLRLVFILIFALIFTRLAFLQVITKNDTLDSTDFIASNVGIIRSNKGQIYIQDTSSGRQNLPITATKTITQLFVDAYILSQLKESGMDIEEAVLELSSRLNIPFKETLNKINTAIAKEEPSRYVVIAENMDSDSIKSISFLQTSKDTSKYRFYRWLGTDKKQLRSYPEQSLLSASVGFTPNYLVGEEEIRNRFADCLEMVNQNSERGTASLDYIVGAYGIEQKYCSELGGLNGRTITTQTRRETQSVLNGADIYLTIDKNIQEKAEQVLLEAVRRSTNANGGPDNGAILVVEAKTGAIRAMASYPYFDPNIYYEYADPDNQKYNPSAFRNAATSIDYDIGSVMKPITVASALEIWQESYYEENIRKGVPPNWTFIDYDKKGKPYEERNGNIIPVQNANGVSYQDLGRLGLKEIVRDSINTGIADIVDATGARKLHEYYENKFRLGQETIVDLPGDTHGNITRFEGDKECPVCWANFGYGQGFTASPLQVVRAYTAIANKGLLIEPYLVEKIAYKDEVNTVVTKNSPGSSIYTPDPQPIISEQTANLVSQYMQAVIEDGYLGNDPSTARVASYVTAGKTGTAEVNRPYQKTDSAGKPLFKPQTNSRGEIQKDKNGEVIMVPDMQSCDYLCNRKRGIYDHSFVGFGPVKNPEYIIMVKLSEPNPGEVNNFSSNTVGRPYSEMMEFVLNYKGVPKDR